ncbi:MAG: nuclear transport factor 2 family protein [Flavisolibacter sp.]
MKKLLYVIVLFILPAVLHAQNNSSAQMEVMMRMATLRNSLLKKDSAALSSVLASEVTYGHSNGLIQTKAQLIRSVMSGEQDYKSIDPSKMNVRIYDNTAVVTMNSMVHMIYQGKATDLNMEVMLVWVKKDKDWLLVARQSVKI